MSEMQEIKNMQVVSLSYEGINVCTSCDCSGCWSAFITFCLLDVQSVTVVLALIRLRRDPIIWVKVAHIPLFCNLSETMSV
jgi:hypothetical protein